MSEWDPGWDEYLDTKLNALKNPKVYGFKGVIIKICYVNVSKVSKFMIHT